MPIKKIELRYEIFMRAIGILSLVFFITSCASFPKDQPQVEALVLSNNYGKALQILTQDKNAYGTNNELLYLLDKGFLEHLNGDYAQSIETFTKAQMKFDELYTESLGKIAATWVFNDYSAPYHGEDFEHVFINVFQALNYLMLGKYDDAIVEARDVDSKLNAINAQYNADQKNVYKEDAFIRMLIGIFYEAGSSHQDINDAYISYTKAAEIYDEEYNENYGLAAPEMLKENILTTAKEMGWMEFNKAKEKYADTQMITLKDKRKKAEVYFIQYNGISPVKIEDSVIIPMLDGHIVKVAFPKYQRRPYGITSSRILVKSSEGEVLKVNSERVQDIGAIAIKNLARRKVRFIAKSALRATGRYMIEKKQVENIEKIRGRETAGWFSFFANVYNIMIEKADLRCWRSLPDEIRIARIILDPGDYEFNVENFNDSGANLGILNVSNSAVKAGEKLFFMIHTSR
ncbi:MAG: hypothetical protein V1739_05285 [Candidatus Omnitrophota bacterium]